MIQPSRRSRGRNLRDAASLDERYLERSGHQEGKTELPADERQQFGQTAATWMVVQTDPRGQQAILTRLSPGGDTNLQPNDVIQALGEYYHIEQGIDEEAIASVLSRAIAKPHAILNCNQVVARARTAVPGDDGRIEWEGDLNEEILEEAFQVHAALHLQPLEAVMKCSARGVIVLPEQVLARVYPETQGTPGCNIFGEEVQIPGRPMPLDLGENVRLEEDKIVAECFGYVGLEDNELSIAPPLWLADDAMRAVYVHFELFAKPPVSTEEAVRATLAARGITYGIDDRAIAKLCSKRLSPKRKRFLTLARGGQPINGEDTRIEYTFDPEQRAGKIMADGSIDFRDRNLVIGVAEDQLLATIHPATEGIKGYNIFSEELGATDGKEIAYKAGENVRAEGDPPVELYAAVEGNAHVAGDTVHVKPVFVISGDVDYETGNIDTTTDVQIAGNVRAGFIVESGGSIMVSGSVESGATVVAQGDVIVSQGIVGEQTNVVARGLLSMGTVQCKFIQTAGVLAKEAIEVGSYIFNAQVRCGGTVTVHSGGGKRGGSIVGGEVFAAQSISARQVGSSTTAGTVVGINSDPVTAIKLAKLKKELRELDHSIERQLRTLGLDTIDSERIKQIQHNAPKARREHLAEVVSKLYEAAEVRDKVRAEIEPLAEKNAEVGEEAGIDIAGTIYPGAEVHIGQALIIVPKEISRSRFYLEDDAVKHKSL